jgi:hypothetical protein
VDPDRQPLVVASICCTAWYPVILVIRTRDADPMKWRGIVCVAVLMVAYKDATPPFWMVVYSDTPPPFCCPAGRQWIRVDMCVYTG